MTRTQKIALCVPFAVLLPVWPAVQWAGDLVERSGLHPLAFLGLLTGAGVAAGAACGLAGRPIAAAVRADGDPPPLSAGRVRGAAAFAAACAAGLAAALLSHEVWTRRFAGGHRRLIEENPLVVLSPPGPRETAPAAEIALQDARYSAGVDSLLRRDAYFHDLAGRVGLDLPDWLTRGIDHAVPIYAAALAAFIAWRLSRPAPLAEEPSL